MQSEIQTRSVTMNDTQDATPSLTISGKRVVISGWLPRMARLRSEYFETMDDPDEFLKGLRAAGPKADVFTFVGDLSGKSPVAPYPAACDYKSVLEISDYEHWWKNRINDKTRNMIRKAGKKGVSIELTQFDAALVKGIKEIYDESPLRQGRPFPHYGKDLETVERENASFLNRSDIIAARFNGELIGFAKLVHANGHSALMQIIAKNSHRDKAPMNALLAKAIEICAQKKVPYLMYGKWGQRGLGEFKKHHGFECMQIRRYFVPLNFRGRFALAANLHQSLVAAGRRLIPEALTEFLAGLRTRFYSRWYGTARH
jgi:hypothetical protein